MIQTSTIFGGILVGGRNRRMNGYPKGQIVIDEKPIVTRLNALLGQVCAKTFLLGEDPRYGALNIKTLPDAYIGAGPLSGITSLLKHTEGEQVVIVPCDTPNLTLEVLSALLEVQTQQPVACQTSMRKHPLVSRWRKPHLAAVLQGMLSQRSVTDTFESLNGVWLNFPDETVFANLNSADDMAQFGARAKLLPQHI